MTILGRAMATRHVATEARSSGFRIVGSPRQVMSYGQMDLVRVILQRMLMQV